VLTRRGAPKLGIANIGNAQCWSRAISANACLLCKKTHYFN